MQADALIREWAEALELPDTAWSSSGRLTLVVDDRYRIHLMPAPNGSVAIEARVCELPAPRTERERVIEEAMHISTGLMREHGAVLALDAQAETLVLQDAVPAHAGLQALSDVLGRFVDSLSLWRKALVR